MTGWQSMVLRAAKNVGCDVPPAAIERAEDYLNRSQNGSGAFCYTPGSGATPAAPPGRRFFHIPFSISLDNSTQSDIILNSM